MNIQEARDAVGRQVVYRPHPHAEPEQGVITSVSPPDQRGVPFVFVRYDGRHVSQATRPGDLELVAG
jgi:hypothetical protein